MALLKFERVLLLGVIVSCAFSQDLPSSTETQYQYGRAIKCKRDDGISQRCMPVFENIAFDKDIYANNTCGLTGPMEYCVQTGTSGAKKICDHCDNRNAGQRHPADLMTDMNLDETPTWWQSDTLLTQKYGAHLILDFKKKYNVAFVRIRFHTIRPHSFAIYKKSTYDPNEEWLPYQFYSRTCKETYNLPDKANVQLSNQKVALCSDEASGMIPLSGGNVAYLTLYNRPGKKQFDSYPELQEWVTVTALRFNFDRLNTFGDEVFGDPKVLKSYYIAVSDIAVGGRCKCNGHASTCDRDDSGNHYCECDHNTAGKDCEKCLPLFNDRPWRRATGRLANPCRACDCNGLADECVFDPQLWLDSNNLSGGRCTNCQKNTAGIHCERCKEYHYRETRNEVCKPCNCNQVGSLSLSCNNQGRCACKPGITGDKCDNCKPGYYGFSSSGCRRCNCNYEGSLITNCDASGQCKCKDDVIGKQCNKCKPSYFDLETNNPKGCKACFCYGHGISCKALDSSGLHGGIGKRVIKSSFETDFDGWKLEDEYGNDYSQNLEWNIREQYVYVRPVENKELYFVAPKRYLGNRLTSYTKVFSFLYGVFKQRTDPQPLTSRKDIIIESHDARATYEITDQGNQKPTDRFINFKFRLVEPPGMTTFNFQRLLSNVKAVKIRVTYLPSRRGAIDDIKLESTQFVSQNSPEQVKWAEDCVCKQGYTGTQCNKCDAGYTRSTGTKAPYGRCIGCECNSHGTRCHAETGVCQCNDNTTGRNCEICKTGFYGNPTRGTIDDCKPCPCLFANECILIGSRVKCTNCPTGHIGDVCEVCADGYFGDPKGLKGKATRCVACDCSGNVDVNEIGNCDTLTGKCLKCVNSTKNGLLNKCEKCADGFYGDALKGTCKSCNCFANGTKMSAGHVVGSPIPCDQSGKCVCRNNVIGDRCDTCPKANWNVASGMGCEQCKCDARGSTSEDCDITTGKCKCRPGVAGRMCDQCAAGHYKFSSKGCSACNCNQDGSKHQNCTRLGVCECLSGVQGLKCDQCPDNKYNLSIGCISCPKCFELIQVAVIDLRERMKNFNISGDLAGAGSLRIRDKNFENVLKALKEKINGLKKRMEDLLRKDDDLFKFFKSLTEQFKTLTDEFDDLEKMLGKSDGASKTGQVEIKKAEDTIDAIKRMLKDLEKKLEVEGQKIYKKAQSGSDDIGDVSKRMRQIAEEARQLADKHEEQAEKIKNTSDKALNSSRKAHKTALNAREREEKQTKDLQAMVVNATEAKQLAKESERLIKKADKSSNASLTEANKLIEDGKNALPLLNVDATKRDSNELEKKATNIDDESKRIKQENKPSIAKLDEDDIEARALMLRGYKSRNASNALFNEAQDANNKAKKAQAEGKKVADEAKDMLQTLEGFEIQIRRSKANATQAKLLIPKIKALIASANKSAYEADRNAELSQQDAIDSLNTIKVGNTTAANAKTESDDILAEAKKLLLELIAFAENEIANTKQDIEDVNKNISKYQEQAKKDAIAVSKADKDSVQAFNATSEAQDELTDVLGEVEALLVAINALGDIDFAALERAEKALKKANERLDGKIKSDIDVLRTKVSTQEKQITDYTLDLTELKKQLANTEKLFKYFPTTCYRVKGVLETF